ncbi:MAG: peptidoglycan-binding protein [Cyanobacteria bacterium J06638_20]
MENLAFLHASAAYEDPSEEPKLRSLEEMGLTPNNPFVMGAAGLAVGAAVLANPSEAEALVGFGDTGSAVADVQATLISNGYSPGGVDGVFGSGTEGAVIAFQVDNFLSPDGVVGPSTAAAMGLSGPEYEFGSGGGGGPDGGPDTVTVSTNGSPLTVRSGPGLGFAPIDFLANGTTVGVVDAASGWYEISGGGWIAVAWTVEGGSGGGGVGGGGGAGTLVISTNGSELVARSGPGLGFAIVGGYSNGAVVDFFDYSPGWYETSAGWVSESWVFEI